MAVCPAAGDANRKRKLIRFSIECRHVAKRCIKLMRPESKEFTVNPHFEERTRLRIQADRFLQAPSTLEGGTGCLGLNTVM